VTPTGDHTPSFALFDDIPNPASSPADDDDMQKRSKLHHRDFLRRVRRESGASLLRRVTSHFVVLTSRMLTLLPRFVPSPLASTTAITHHQYCRRRF
jgi:hypothetical protein